MPRFPRPLPLVAPLAILLFLLAFAGAAPVSATGEVPLPSATGFDPAGTFFEPVTEVLREKMAAVPPAGTLAVWIPYTRIDLAVRDGIEMTRILQTYRNGTAENLGYNFTAPIFPDTTFTGFTVWDMGTRHVGTLEDREAAEAAYKRTTGDEAPEINRDPGLVRRTENTLSLRIFPIQPDEFKQMELVSHRRLGLAGDSFEVLLPLDRICVTFDDKGARHESRSTEVSVFVTDRLPIVSFEAPPGFAVTPLPDNRFLVRGACAAGGHERLAVRYRVAIPPEGHAALFPFSDGGKNFLLARLAGRWSPAAPPDAAPQSLYLGLWVTLPEKPDTTEIAALLTPERMRLAATGAFAFPLLPRDAPLHLSFHAFHADKYRHLTMAPRDGIYSAEPFRRAHFTKPGAREIERLFEKDWRKGPVAHLARAIERGASTVLLALEPPPAKEAGALADLARRHPSVRFFLAFAAAIPEGVRGIPNVHPYSYETGWDGLPPVHPPRRLLNLYEEMPFSELLPLEPGFLDRFLTLAGGLPHLDGTAPLFDTTGEAGLSDARFYLPLPEYGVPGATGECAVVWLSATFPASGTSELSVTIPETQWNFLAGREAERILRIARPVALPAGETADRFVATFVAKHEARSIEARLAQPRGRGGAMIPDHLRLGEAERKELRKRLVELSKRYSFLTPETAFIALPPDLREKYGFKKQDFETGRLYDLAGMKKGGLPEPADWLILALALAAFAWWRRRASRGRGGR